MIPLLRGWTTVQRTAQNNIRLGMTLCFVAGATNAGGFLAVGQYTSHMTGVLSSVADKLVHFNRLSHDNPVTADQHRLGIHLKLVGSIFVGGLSGAIGFKNVGFAATVASSVLPLMVVLRPVLNDAKKLD